MSTNPLNFAKDSGFQSSFLQSMPYQIVETREIPLNRSSYKGKLPKVPLQPPRLVNQLIPSSNQIFSQTQVTNSSFLPQAYQPQIATQLVTTNQANIIPSSPVQLNQTIVPSFPVSQSITHISSIPSSNVPMATHIQSFSTNNITKSVEESEVEYPPEQIQTVQEVVERKIIVRPDLEKLPQIVNEVSVPNSQSLVISQVPQIQVIPENIISTNSFNLNTFGKTNEETATVREVIQKTVKIQPSPIAKVYKKEIIERKIPVSQYATSEPKVSYSNAEIVSQEIIREIKPEIKQQVIMTQVPRQVVIPIKKQISGSPERHIVFGQERIVISPRIRAQISPTNISCWSYHSKK